MVYRLKGMAVNVKLTNEEIQKEIEELEFELCHDVGLLTRVNMEERIGKLKGMLKG